MKVFKKGYVVFVNMEEDDPLIEIMSKEADLLLGVEIGYAIERLWRLIPEGYLLSAVAGDTASVVKLPT